MKTPRTLISFLAGAVLLAASNLNAATTEPVGYQTISLPASGGNSSTTFVSIAMVNSPEASGTVGSADSGANTLTVTNASFGVDAFITGGTYYVEITSGAASAGKIATITDNDATTLTLSSTEDDITGVVSGGETLVIRKYRTIGDVFGAANEAGLGEGTANNFADADLILLPNGSGGFDQYFYNDFPGQPVFTGWRKTSAVTVDASGVPLRPSAGFVVIRKVNSPLEIVVSGAVQVNSFEIAIENGANFIASSYPTDTTIADLFGENNEAGLVEGNANNFAGADLILVPNGAGGFDQYFYNNFPGQPVFTGWRKTTAVTVDAKDQVISTGSSQSFVLVREGSGFDLVQAPNFSL